MAKVKQKHSNLIMGGLIVLVAGLMLGYIEMPSTQDAPTVTGAVGAAANCGTDDGKIDLKVKAVNPANASKQLVAVTTDYVKDGQSIGTLAATTTGFGTATDALLCDKTYEVRILDDRRYASIKPVVIKVNEPIEEHTFDVVQTSPISFSVHDTSYSNMTMGFVHNDTNAPATAIGSGGTSTWIVRAKVTDASSEFGSRDAALYPTYFCADFSLSKYAKGDVTLTSSDIGISESATLPTWCTNNGYDKAWKLSDNLRVSEPYYEMRLTATASLGDPGATDDITLYVVDTCDVEQDDLSIVVDSVDTTGSDSCGTNEFVKIDVS